MRHTFSRTTLLALGAVATAALGAVAAIGAGMATASSHGAAQSRTMIGVKHVAPFGSILYAGPKRLTVYAFARDGRNRSTCTGACAKAWPPVTTTTKPKATGGASTRDLAMIARAGGVKQVTYKGHPLYYFVGDKTSATAAGQAIDGFGARWYVLSPSGREITTQPPPTSTSPTTTTTTSTTTTSTTSTTPPSTTTTTSTTSTTPPSTTTTTPSTTTTTSPSPGWG